MACVAVVDVETTGLNPFRGDRIVEVAAVVIQDDGTILREFVTIINPERDMGPIHIHGLATQDILAAPRFGEIAGAFLETINGCVALAGHNVRFDQSFLAVEFNRIGYAFPDCPMLCTMRLAGGGSLSSVCAEYGVAIEGQAHSALHDARSTAQLLAVLLKDAPNLTAQISNQSLITWPNILKSSVKPLTRDVSRILQAKPSGYLEKLLLRAQPELPYDSQDSAIFDYTALLDRALEDRHIDDEEGKALVNLAIRWHIPPAAIQTIHNDYLLRLATAALSGGLTDSERRELLHVANLLGIDSQALNEIMEIAAKRLADEQPQTSASNEALARDELVGKNICFTGECQCQLKGQSITRELAEEIAESHGMTVTESVTKALDILVVADPVTQSGKAKKARQYGIRIIHEPVFWRVLGLEVG